MIQSNKVEQPRKMIDTRIKLCNTTGKVKRNKSGDVIIIKSFQ